MDGDRSELPASGAPPASRSRLRLSAVISSIPARWRAVALGMVLNLGCSFVVLATIWLLPGDRHPVVVVTIELASIALACLAGFAVRNQSTSGPRLMAFPLLIVATLLSLEATSTALGTPYTGFIIVAFIFIGLTQRRWMSLWLLAPAIPAWYLCQSTPFSVTAVRFPITVTTWLVVAELLASRTRRMRVRVGELIDAAHTDHLTGLGNRRLLAETLATLADGEVVVLIDLDHFKAVNDTLGHEAGDQILREFANVVLASLRTGDIAFRYGGEELVVLMRHGDGSYHGPESLLTRLRQGWISEGRPTFSAGVAVHRGGDPAETMSRADLALYEAKRSGRDCWRFDRPAASRIESLAALANVEVIDVLD